MTTPQALRGARSAVPIDLAVAIAVALLVRVAFVLYTSRVWEDALITIAHAKSAAAGLGLTHHPGEGPTHGFTSAISVLVPLVGESVTVDGGMAVLRLASLVAAVAALVFAWRIAVHFRLSQPMRALVLVFLAVEQNQVFYGMAGMETQIAVAILLGGFWHALQGNAGRAGFAAGLAVLARPEAIVLLLPFLMVSIWVSRGPRSIAQALAIAAVVVAPWLLFTTLYYGSPIPQTIIAKSATYSVLPGGTGPVDWLVVQVRDHVEPMLRTFMPFLADTMVATPPMPAVIPAIIGGIVVIAVVYGMIRALPDRRWWGLLGFLVAYSAYRVLFLPTSYYDWYVPPAAAVGIIVAAKGLDAFFVTERTRWVVAIALSAAFVVPLPWFFAMERAVQEIADSGVRTQVAEYLRAHVEPAESVTSESAGYVGTSGVTLWDYPGLTSPTALQAIQAMPREVRSVSGLVAAARPDWAVLRQSEIDALRRFWPTEAAAYELCTTIGPGGGGIEVAGMAKRSYDLEFLVVRRHPCPSG